MSTTLTRKDIRELQEKLDLTSSKSFWRPRTQARYQFYCPHCRIPRRLPYDPRPGNLRHAFQVGLTAGVFTLATWPLFTWKGIVSFVPIWIIFEVYYRLGLRAALRCDACGFDPFLYLTDVQKARAAIEEHWRAKFAEKGIPFPGDEPQARGGGEEEKATSAEFQG